MIWSEQELQNLALGGANVTVKRVMSRLSEPENAAIFAPENFSYLWGALGVAGVKGADAAACEKIWEALAENGALDAFDKGILGDFNKALAARFRDNRLRAWLGLDNFQAGIKFKTAILQGLEKVNSKLEENASTYCLNGEKLAESLQKYELGGKLAAYLDRLRGINAACGLDGEAAAKIYEKTAVLRKLCDVIAYGRRKMSEREKDYLFHYLREATADGFKAEAIGLDDTVLAKLAADEALGGLSELEAAPLLLRNQEIAEFAAGFEEENGFYEEVAAKVVKHDHLQVQSLTGRCLSLMNGRAPKGVVYALALLELNQVKSVVSILLELSKRGRALEMTGFTHRLLPRAKGAEGLILDILRANLQHLAVNEPCYREYAGRRSLCAARDFAETGHFKEAAALLAFLVSGGWLSGAADLAREFMRQANYLIMQDVKLSEELCLLAKKLNLRIYHTDDGVVIGTAEDNPLTAARRRLEQAVLSATTIDLSKATKKIKGLEASTYDMYQNIKGVFGGKKRNEAPETAAADKPNEAQSAAAAVTENLAAAPAAAAMAAEIPAGVTTFEAANPQLENVVEDSAAANYAEVGDEPEAAAVEMAAAGAKIPETSETAVAEPSAAEGNMAVAEPETMDTVKEIPVKNENSEAEEGNASDTATHSPDAGDGGANAMATADDADTGADLAQTAEANSVQLSIELPKIEDWEDESGEAADGKNDKDGVVNKININNILKINSKEVDKHFEKIRQVTSHAIKRAEEQAAAMKKRVEDADFKNSPSVGKIRELAKKISFFKKK